MEEMQEKLKQYRLRKRRKERFDNLKSKIRNFLIMGIGNTETNKNGETAIDIWNVQSKNKLDGLAKSDSTSASSAETSMDDEEKLTSASQSEPSNISPEHYTDNKWFKYTLWSVYFLFWVTLYIIAIELRFGVVFLMFSALFGIYFNTRTGPKKTNEISAYSVFNKNFESIDGTLKAEQFEREMMYGVGSVK